MTAVAVHDPSADVASLPLRFLAQAIDGLIYFGVVTLLIRATGNHSLELVADSGVPLFSLGWAMAYELEFLLLWSATPGKATAGTVRKWSEWNTCRGPQCRDSSGCVPLPLRLVLHL